MYDRLELKIMELKNDIPLFEQFLENEYPDGEINDWEAQYIVETLTDEHIEWIKEFLKDDDNKEYVANDPEALKALFTLLNPQSEMIDVIQEIVFEDEALVLDSLERLKKLIRIYYSQDEDLKGLSEYMITSYTKFLGVGNQLLDSLTNKYPRT
ncbi:hypothetical protein IKF63_00980 [Candidatus Saccharibacteria bacterium]|nr:hypothetical protein [Candidatus Saccharibacteria bacterium]